MTTPSRRLDTLDRREFLYGLGGLAGLVTLSRLPGDDTPEVPPYLDDPFTLGVASGDPLPDGVVLWTRLAPDPLAEDGSGGMPMESFGVRWQVAEDERFARIVRRGAIEARPELAHSVHVEVSGLQPGREYYYRFLSGRAVSRVGRTRTAPAPGASVDRLNLGFISCQLYLGDGTYAAHRNLAREDLDLVVHVGDYIYERFDTATLTDFRNLHALYKTSPDLQASHAQFPYVLTFDDHDVDNDWASSFSQGYPDVSEEEFLELRAAAFQAYYEHLPLRHTSIPRGPDMQVFRRLDWGDLAQLHVLDTRQYRSNQVGSGFPCGPRDPLSLDPTRTMTGDEQERWLLDGLAASGARWNVIAQQTMMAKYDYDTGEGECVNHDQWDGYVPSRQRILEGIASRRPSNPVVLSGDWHSSWVNDLKLDFDDPDSPAVATEFVGTSISSGCGWRDDVAFALAVNPHVKFFDGDLRGYLRCSITPGQWRSDFRVVPSPTDPVSPASTLTSWMVIDGRPGARQVGGADGISGRVTDDGVGVAGVTVQALDAIDAVIRSSISDGTGAYRLLVPPGDFQVIAFAGCYETATAEAHVADGVGAAVDFALTRVTGVAARSGKQLSGALVEGRTTDLVIENSAIAVAVSLGTEDGQLLGTTVGKVLDMNARAHTDQLDWINLPYASASQPRGTEAWQQATVRHDDVRVVEHGSDRAVVRASGVSTQIAGLSVVTTYAIERDQQWVTAETVYANSNAGAVEVWAGDALDHDGSGQHSLTDAGVITAPYGSPDEYDAVEPWIGMAGNHPQAYGLLYDVLPGDLVVYGTGSWIMSQFLATVPGGGSTVLRRRVAVAPADGDSIATLSRLYNGG